jgi:hypothetical protein
MDILVHMIYYNKKELNNLNNCVETINNKILKNYMMIYNHSKHLFII